MMPNFFSAARHLLMLGVLAVPLACSNQPAGTGSGEAPGTVDADPKNAAPASGSGAADTGKSEGLDLPPVAPPPTN